jgi:DNA replication and repair protein RecF
VPTLLLDDPGAELDREHTAALLREARDLEGQLIVTALSLGSLIEGQEATVFHVERGQVRPLEL